MKGFGGHSNTLQSPMGGNFLPFHVDTVAVCGHLPGFYEKDLIDLFGQAVRISAEGELLYQKVLAAPLPGTWSSNLHVMAMRNHPYGVLVRVEGSVHKFALGHNVYGGTQDLPAVAEFLRRLPESFQLPALEGAWLARVDLALNMRAASQAEAVRTLQSLLRGIRESSALRRRPTIYETSCQAGVQKLYLKLPELLAHPPATHRGDESLDHAASKSEFDYLCRAAEGIIRYETRFNSRDLVRCSSLSHLLVDSELVETEETTYYRRGDGPKHIWLDTLDLGKLLASAESRRGRFLRIVDTDSQQSMAAIEVQHRLVANYGPSEGAILFGTWLSLCSIGESATKANLSKSTYYRHLSKLKKASCPWRSTNFEFDCLPSLVIEPLVTDPKLLKLIAR